MATDELAKAVETFKFSKLPRYERIERTLAGVISNYPTLSEAAVVLIPYIDSDFKILPPRPDFKVGFVKGEDDAVQADQESGS